MEEAGLLPTHLPPVRDAVVAADGSVWLRRDWRVAGLASWMVFDREGRPIAEIELPASIDLRAVAGDLCVGVELDEYDVPYLVQLRITRP